MGCHKSKVRQLVQTPRCGVFPSWWGRHCQYPTITLFHIEKCCPLASAHFHIEKCCRLVSAHAAAQFHIEKCCRLASAHFHIEKCCHLASAHAALAEFPPGGGAGIASTPRAAGHCQCPHHQGETPLTLRVHSPGGSTFLCESVHSPDGSTPVPPFKFH